MTNGIFAAVQENCTKYRNFPRPEGELFFTIPIRNELISLIQFLEREQYSLLNIALNDERGLEAHAYMIYYTFSGGEPRQFVILGHAVNPAQTTLLPSIRKIYEASIPFEQEIADFFGLFSDDGLSPEETGLFLHSSAFPVGHAPLRQDHYQKWLKDHQAEELTKPAYLNLLQTGKSFSVGPIHAQIIGGGLFLFKMKGGETIEDVFFVPGHQHRGIEKMFEIEYTLRDGWKLAECITGDTAFAYGMAYCEAVESLTQVNIPPAANYWRALFLELERITNHIGDVANSFHGISAVLFSNRLFTLLEACYQLIQQITSQPGCNPLENSNFILRGMNRVGGVILPSIPNLEDLQSTLNTLVSEFVQVALGGMRSKSICKRLASTGILTSEQAYKVGAAGFVARASGLLWRDTRIMHPHGAYADAALNLQDIIQETVIPKYGERDRPLERIAAVYEEDLTGDALARMAIRVAEVEVSMMIINRLVKHLKRNLNEKLCLTEDEISQRLEQTRRFDRPYRFGLGIAESWRGEVIFQIWEGPDNSIYRCNFRDPSVFNWPALRISVQFNMETKNRNLFADFPVINKSYNNSYPGVSK